MSNRQNDSHAAPAPQAEAAAAAVQKLQELGVSRSPPQPLPGRVTFAVGGRSYSTRDLIQRSQRIAHEYTERLLGEILDGAI